MDAFEFKLEENTAKTLTGKTALLKYMGQCYRTADPALNYNTLETYYSESSLDTLQKRKQHFELFKIAKARFIELGHEITPNVPLYINNNEVIVNVRMTLEQANEWVKENSPNA